MKTMGWNEELSPEVANLLGEYETGYEREVGYTKVSQFCEFPTLADLENLTEFINVY